MRAMIKALRDTLFLLLVISLSNCATKHGQQLTKMEDKYVDLGFASSPRCDGTFFNRLTGEQMYYYSNIFTTKCVKIFDSNFQLKATIPLNDFPDRQNIRWIQVIAQDTVAILCYRGIDVVYVCDFSGKITRTIDTHGMKEGDMHFETPMASGTSLYHDSKLYLKYALNKSKLYHSHDQNYETYKKSDSMLMDCPYMVSIDLFTNDSAQVFNKLFYNIYKENYEYGDAIYDDGGYHFIANDKLFMFIGHNGKLYIVDLQTQQIEKIITLESDHTKIGYSMKPYRYTPDSYTEHKGKQHSFLWYNASNITSIAWDRHKKQYYISIQHLFPIPFEHTDSWWSKRKSQTYSILVLDENFEKKGEAIMPLIGSIKVHPRGILIENTMSNTDKEYDKNVKKYTLFAIGD